MNALGFLMSKQILLIFDHYCPFDYLRNGFKSVVHLPICHKNSQNNREPNATYRI